MTRILIYILDDDGNPMPAPGNSLGETVDSWNKWMMKNNLKVKVDTIGGCKISTVFLGLDHNYSMKGPPLLFETMVFGGPRDQLMFRSSSRKYAEADHERAIQEVKAAIQHEESIAAIKAAHKDEHGDDFKKIGGSLS